jgi:hypothetical protein
MSRASLKALVNTSILTGGNRTKAVDVRALMYAIIDEVLNIPDDITSLPGLTAFAAGGQTNATVLTEVVSRIDICLVEFGSVKVTPATENTKKTIINGSGRKIKLFPAVGERFWTAATGLMAVNEPLIIAHRNQITVYCFKNEAGIYSTI